MTKNGGFTFASLSLSVVCAAAAECLLGAGPLPSARAALTLGLLQAAALYVISALCAVAFGGKRAPVLCAALWLWLAFELAQTVWQTQSLCWQQFSSKAALGAAPFLIWFGARRMPRELDRTARVLWGFAVSGALVCVLGLGGLLRWQRLLAAQQGRAFAPVYAEYFALPFICGQSVRRRTACLPLYAFLVQAGFCVGWQLLFGEGEGYSSLELLRALELGAFSRLDAFLVLMWLVLALYRICLLGAVMRFLWQNMAQWRGRGEAAC